jgi:hypothetical protein
LVKKKNKLNPFFLIFFVEKEKWKTLALELYGKEFPIYTEEQITKIALIFSQYLAVWKIWQPRNRKFRNQAEKSNWRFKNRKHMPNFNFCTQQIHWILGLTHLNSQFPCPTTEKSLEQLKYFWWEMSNKIGYPCAFDEEMKRKEELERKKKNTKQKTLYSYFKPIATKISN